ncbi:MAG: hypothetical protein ABIA78_04055 [archaeon]
MGFFNFFKKIGNGKAIDKIVIEKLSFSEIENWIENKSKENNLREREILSMIGQMINNLVKELEEKIVILENFDVEAKKEKDQIKNIVMDSRERYVESVQDLIERLNNLEELELERFIEKINIIFLGFNKSSFKNYERATILIGNEIASIKKSLQVFSKDLLRVYEESKPLLDSFKNLLIVKEKLDLINIVDKTLDRIIKEKLNLDKKINEREEESKTLKRNLGEIKTSQNYLENLDKQKKIKFLREESKNNLLELKQLLDFKALASFFHINPEQMRIVKNYREDFQINFEQDNGKVIVRLLEEAGLNNKIILEKIEQIRSQIGEIARQEENLQKDEAQKISFRIDEIGFEVNHFKIEKVKIEKREENFRIDKGELVSLLKQKFSEMNVEVV